MRKVEEITIQNVISIIDNAIHPGIPFSHVARIRQDLMMSTKVENGNSTNSADSQTSV